MRMCPSKERRPFGIFIPRQIVPHPSPRRSVVGIEADAARGTVPPANIKEAIQYVYERAAAVRCTPTGDPEGWRIGAPYVPMGVLTPPWSERLNIAASW